MDKDEQKNKLVKVEGRPLEVQPAQKQPNKIGNLRINKIGKFTLNVFVEPVKKRYQKHYRENIFLLITDITLALIVIILAAVLLNIFVFSRYKKVNLIDLKVASVPVDLINGQTTKFNITCANTTNDPLEDLILVIKTPASLHNAEFSPPDFDQKTNSLKIGELAAKAFGQFEIKGMLLGNFDEKQEFLTVINYKNKYGQTRQEFFSQEFQLKDSVLKTTIDLPAKIIATNPFTVKIGLKNNSELNLDKLKISMIWPENFSLKNTDLGEPLNDQTYLVGKFKAGQENFYIFNGKIYGEKIKDLNFQTKIWADYDQAEYLFSEVQNTAPLAFSKLELSFIETEKNLSLSPGAKTIYTLHYKNNESYALGNVELGLNLNGEYVAGPNHLSLNQNDYNKLAKIEPGQENSLPIEVTTKNSIEFKNYQENGFQIEARIFASYDDSVEKNRLTIENSPFYTKINSTLALNTQGIFYTPQGDQIGVGSVPPKVGEYTSYWAIIRINNTVNKITNLKVTAAIPAGIEFTNIYNVTDGNQISYSEKTRQIEWQVDSITAFAGIFVPAPEARIQLALTPTKDQVGKSPLLLTNISATATDSETKSFLSANGKNISISIFPDESLNRVIE
ncbi:MAG: hypothetical protein NTX00_00085 [Candidatus Parcubacteria bacterium]|nr:hypothetical protein [Candidatus Parcubacteria bacterium]